MLARSLLRSRSAPDAAIGWLSVCVGASRVAVVPAAGSARSHATDSSKRPRRLYVGDVASVSLRVSEEWGPLIAAGVHASAGHIARRVIGAGGATARGLQQRSGAVRVRLPALCACD